MVITLPAPAHPPPELTHVAEKPLEVSSRRSAMPTAGGNEVMSTARKRKRVTIVPVLFLKVRRMESVPSVAFVPGVVSRCRAQVVFEAAPAPLLFAQPLSTREALMVALRCSGLERFSGPGAPRCRPPMVPSAVAPVEQPNTNKQVA